METPVYELSEDAQGEIVSRCCAVTTTLVPSHKAVTDEGLEVTAYVYMCDCCQKPCNVGFLPYGNA